MPVAPLKTDESGSSLPRDWLATARAPVNNDYYDDCDDYDDNDYDDYDDDNCDRLATARAPF